MSMKQLMTEWRSFLKESVVTHPRIVLNEIMDLSEAELASDKYKFTLSDEELSIIKEWGDLDDEYPTFLGSGTMGFAWKVGDKVLKITSDFAEAEAAMCVEGKQNDHVYEVYKVGKRSPQFTEEPNRRYVVICELVGDAKSKERFPDPTMQDAIQYLHNSQEKTKYRWVEDFPELMNRFRDALPQLEEIFSLEPEGGSERSKLEKVLKVINFTPQEQDVFKLAWIGCNGVYGNCLTSAEKALQCSEKPKFDYIDQVCQGLTFLFQNGVEFRDLKTSNVLNDNGRLVIIDIGKSLVRDRKQIPNIE